MTDKIKSFWNLKANDWALKCSDKDSYFTRRTHLISDLITRHVPRCRSLDVGCGSGLLIELLINAGYNAYGCDLADGMVKEARKRLDGVVDDACARISVSTQESIPFDFDFELISVIGVFSYIPNYGAFLKSLSARLMSGGFICATCTKRFSFYSLMKAGRVLLRGGIGVALNLIRTGLWSGGHVNLSTAKQCYSAKCFDHLFANYNYKLVDSFGMYNFKFLDKKVLCRTKLGKFLVRYFGWNYIALYQKLR